MTSNLPRLHVSANRRHLVRADGTAFFWLGDTAWELFHRLSQAEAISYFDTRQRQGFSVIQAVALAELDGLHTPNQYGALPLIENDPTRPNPAYFDLVDSYIRLAAERGMYTALLPTWGDKVALGLWASENVIFTPESSYTYGRWLGARYRSWPAIIWMLGGDRPAVHPPYDDRPIWRALAAGIRAEVPEALLTYHPNGGWSSSAWLHTEAWLDLHTMQSGHGGGRDVPVWERIAADYALTPPKPTLDSEPNYEDHPVNPWPTWDPANGYFRDDDVRKQLYRSVFAGGCGVTYGHHAVWQFSGTRYPGINHTDRSWVDALTRPAAEQVRHLRSLIEARSPLTRIPDQAMLHDPGAGPTYACATRDSAGRYAYVYIPSASQQVVLDLRALHATRVDASWYDPRTGASTALGQWPISAAQAVTSPASGPDWVLVLTVAA